MHSPHVAALIDQLRIESTETGKAKLYEELAHVGGPRVLSFLNAHGFNVAWNNGLILDCLLSSDWLLRDGIGVAILLALRRKPHGYNLNGTDLIQDLLGHYRGRRVLMMGSCSPWVEKAAEKARADHGVEIVGTLDGFRENSEYLEMAVAHPADLIILGMGTPKQEPVAKLLRENLTGDVLIVNGGGILDFISQRVVRAPGWARKSGLEWIVRLSQDFGRLWRRYLLGNPVFLTRVLLLTLSSRSLP